MEGVWSLKNGKNGHLILKIIKLFHITLHKLFNVSLERYKINILSYADFNEVDPLLFILNKIL